jgi:hypothetical protein
MGKFVQVKLFALFIATLASTAAAQTSASKPNEASAHARTVLLDLAAGEYAVVEGKLDGYMEGALPAEKLTVQWKAMLDHAGAFISVHVESDIT